MNQPTKTLKILLLIITIVVISFSVDFLSQKKSSQEPKTISTPTIYHQTNPTPTVPTADYLIYKFKINLLTSDEFDFSQFVSFFRQQLGISDTLDVYTENLRIYNLPKTKYSQIIKPDYSFDNQEFIALIKNDFNVKPGYQNELYRITLEKDQTTDIQFLLDKFFCQQDSDCQIINYECSYGAYNQYQRLRLPFGCESGTLDYQNNYTFGPYDQVMKCNSQITYQEARCIDNKCIGQNRTIKCFGQPKDDPWQTN